MNHSQKIITKCDGIIANCDSLVYYKVRWTVITNCDTFFITKCDTVYYKLRQVLQSAMDLLQIATGITKCDDYYKLRQVHPPYLGRVGENPGNEVVFILGFSFSVFYQPRLRYQPQRIYQQNVLEYLAVLPY